MGETESQLLLKIKTILESQGVDAAKSKIDELIGQQNAQAASSAKASGSLEKANTVIERTAVVAGMASRVMNGTNESLRAAAVSAQMLFAGLGRLSIVGGIISLVGVLAVVMKQLYERFMETDKAARRTADNLEGMKTALEDLGKARVDQYLKNLEKAADEYERALRSAERLSRIEESRSDAQLGSELAANQLAYETGQITEIERNQRDLTSRRAASGRSLNIEQRKLESDRSQLQSSSEKARKRQSRLDIDVGAADKELQYYMDQLAAEGGGDGGELTGGIDEVQASLVDRENKLNSSWTSNTNADEYNREAQKLRAQRKWAGKIIAARMKKSQALDTIGKTRENDQALISDNAEKIEVLDAQLGLLPTRRETERTRFDAEQAKIQRDVVAQAAIDAKRYQESMPDDLKQRLRVDRAVEGMQQAQGLVLPMSRDENGTMTPEGGRETQAAARSAIGEAGKRIAQGENEAQVYLDLAQKLQEMGAVVSGGWRTLADAVDSMNGTISDLKSELAQIKSRERATRGVE